MATRCCCPPESCAGKRSARPESPTSSSIAPARLLRAAPEAIVVRTAPNKADRRIDVRAFCGTLERTPDGLIAEIQMTEAGTARPDEIATAVAAAIGATPTITRLVRTETLLHDTPAGALT